MERKAEGKAEGWTVPLKASVLLWFPCLIKIKKKNILPFIVIKLEPHSSRRNTHRVVVVSSHGGRHRYGKGSLKKRQDKKKSNLTDACVDNTSGTEKKNVEKKC